MEVQYDGQNAFTAAANGDFPLVVLIWGMAMAVQPAPVDMLVAKDPNGNTIMHHAAATPLEGNTSIVHFLVQQAHGAGREIASIVDARNDAGETPLIRAAHIGNLRVLDTLIQYGHADTNAQDSNGNTAAHHAAAQGHLWVLHYLLTVETKSVASLALPPRSVPPQKASPQAVVAVVRSKGKRNELHYACRGEHKVVVQYLLSQGFDPLCGDENGTNALDLAMERKLKWLTTLLESKDHSFSVPPTKCRHTRFWLVLFYGLMLFAVLSTSYVLPWWIAVPGISIILWKSLAKFRAPHGHGGGGGHSHGGPPSGNPESVHPSKRKMAVAGSVALTATPPTRPSEARHTSFPAMLAKPQPEMIVGVWAGWVITFTFFHVVIWLDPAYSFMVSEMKPFLIALVALEVVFLFTWARLAVLYPSDPGTINTFQEDVTNMLANATQGLPPPEASHCRTCYIRKPLRSKHCPQCGVCVARMDHHCGWINRCVGYGNHRLFMCFLVLHIVVVGGFVALAAYIFQRLLQPSNLVSSQGSANAAMRVWIQVPSLVSGHFLAVLVFLWGIAAALALFSMLFQHLGNISKNLTINEQINWSRYTYLKKIPNGNKKLQLENIFDRGGGTNMAQFWFRKGPSAVDYRKLFHTEAALDDPTADQPLNNTQELV